MARFKLHSHALRVQTRSWEHHDGTCDNLSLEVWLASNSRYKTRSFPFKGEKLPLHANVFAEACFTIYLWHTKLLSIRLELFIFPKLVLKMSSIFFQKQTNDSYRFISKLMDVFLMAGVHQLPDQSNYLAEGQT